MAGKQTEALVAALEACAEALERHGQAVMPQAGSLPRLRPPSLGTGLGAGLGRMPQAWTGWGPGAEMMPERAALAQDALELAAEFRDVVVEVGRGRAGRGWITSLLGRASRHLQEGELAPVRAAALGVL